MKRTRIIALLLACSMLIAVLAACAGGDDDTATPTPGTSPGATTLPPGGDIIPTDDFADAWAGYLQNYDEIADEISALEQWIYEGIQAEVNSGAYATAGTTDWGNTPINAVGTSHLPDSTDEPITFTVFTAGSGQAPARNNPVMLELARITGVTLEWEFTPGDIDQKVGVLIAGGEYADLIAPGQHRGEFLNAGAFANLDGLIQDYDRLWKHFGLYETRLRNATTDNSIRLLDIWGRRYTLGDGLDSLYEADYNGPGFYIQKDVLAWDNYSFPTTLDQFFDLLARYYAAHPTIDGQPTLPFEIFSTDWRSFSLKNPPQHLIGGRNEGDVVVNPDTLAVEIYQNKDYAMRYYARLNQAYHDGLINPETFTRNHDQFMSVIAQGRVLSVFSQQWAFGEGEQVLIGDNRMERTYVPLGLTFDRDEPYPYNRQTHAGIQGGNGGGISVSCSDVERALKFFDQLLMPEIQILLNWGILDKDFYVDENGTFRRTPEQKALHDDPDWRRDNLGYTVNESFVKLEGRLPDGNAVGPGNSPEERIGNMYDYDREFYSNYRLPNGENFTQRADFLPQFEHPGYSEVWSLLSTMDSEAAERLTFDKITDIQNRYLPGVIMS